MKQEGQIYEKLGEHSNLVKYHGFSQQIYSPDGEPKMMP